MDDRDDSFRAITNQELLCFSYKDSLQSYLPPNGPSRGESVFACPADDFNCDDPVIQDFLSYMPPFSGRSFYRQQTTHYSSYAFNGLAPDFAEMQRMGQKPFASVRQPTRVVLAGELSGGLGMSTHERKELYQFNKARSVSSFADGHVSFIRIYWNGAKGGAGIPFNCEPPPGYDYQWSDD